jgi:hypothetical protein
MGRLEAEMTKYLAGVLSVIAAGVLLIAYGLLNPRAAVDASGAMSAVMRPVSMSEPVALRDGTYGASAAYPAYEYAQAGTPASLAAPYTQHPAYAIVPVSSAHAQTAAITAPAPRATAGSGYQTDSPRPARSRSVERPRGRDWKRTALIVGGSSAAGAGVGAIFGGRKGALIGAAVAGGASTIYQTVK